MVLGASGSSRRNSATHSASAARTADGGPVIVLIGMMSSLRAFLNLQTDSALGPQPNIRRRRAEVEGHRTRAPQASTKTQTDTTRPVILMTV
jgi:hypothetical protein